MRRLFLLALLIPAAWTQTKRDLGPVPTYEVKRAPRPIAVDGKLDDTAWKAAGTIEFQFPWSQQTGAKQKTIARVLWDDQFLYVGYDCEDAGIVAHYTERDDPTYKDDAVEIFINPDPAQTYYYGMEMNARAVLYDYFYVFPKLLLKRVNFSGIQLAAHIRGTLNQTGDKDQGWSLEVAIPWANFEELTAKLPPTPGSILDGESQSLGWDRAEPAAEPVVRFRPGPPPSAQPGAIRKTGVREIAPSVSEGNGRASGVSTEQIGSR